MAPIPTSFAVPHAVLPEEVAPVGEVSPVEAPAVELAPWVSSSVLSAMAVESYRPTIPSQTPVYTKAWVETHEELLQSLPSWKPLKEVSQADLDQNLSPEASVVPVVQSENPAQAISEEDRMRALYAQGIPAGVESSTEDEVEHLELFVDENDDFLVPSRGSDSEVFTELFGSG